MADITSRFLQLKAISPMLVGQSWETRIAADAAGALWQSIKGAAYVPLGNRVGLIDGGTNGASLIAAIAQANAFGGGYVIQLGKGVYVLNAAQFLSANGIRIVGNGQESTFIMLDDAGGLAGADAFTVNSVLGCGFEGFTVITPVANVQRTSGSLFKILGKNHITATPAERVYQYKICDVNAEDMFDGLVVNDGPSSQGAWGGLTDNVHWIRFGAGGDYIRVQTPNGGQHAVREAQLVGSSSLSDAQRAQSGIRYLAGADLELTNVSTVYHRYGFLANPVAQIANVCLATKCDFDNNTRSSICITPTAGGQCLGYDFDQAWGYTVLGLGHPCIQIDPDGASNANGIRVQGIFWANLLGARISATWGVRVDNSSFDACTTGVLATNNAHRFLIRGNSVGKVSSSVPLTGIQIDAGCDHYAVIGNELSWATVNPLVNTPGDSAGRRIATNGLNVIL